MTTKKQAKTLDDLRAELVAKAASGPAWRTREEKVRSAIHAEGRGEDVVALRSFKAGDVDYKVGQIYRLGTGKFDRQMIDNGFFVAESDWQAQKDAQEAARQLAELDGLLGSLAAAKAERSRAQATIKALDGEVGRLEAEAAGWLN